MWRTYAELAAEMGVSIEAARKRVRRDPDAWETMRTVDGRVMVRRRGEAERPDDAPPRTDTLPAVRPMLTPIIRVELDAVVRELQASWQRERALYEQRIVELEQRALRAKKRPWWRWWG